MYMPNKKHKQYGIKKLECCDSDGQIMSITLSFIVEKII